MSFRLGSLTALALLFSATLILRTAADAADYYVATDGNDSATGTIDAPWRTLQRAADYPKLAGGDTIHVRGGSYAQRLTITRSGTDAAHPITFAAYPGETPLLDGTTLTPPNDIAGLITIADAAFLRIVGFELANYRATAAATNQDKVPCGIFIHGASHDLEIRGNNIHDISNHFADGNAFGLAAYGDTATPITGLVVAANEIHHCSLGNSESLAINGNIVGFLVANNRVHHNTNIGIVAIGYEGTFTGDPALDRARGGIIRGNTVWECTSTANPAYGNAPGADGLYVDGGTDILIENNTSYQNDIGLELASEHTGRTTDHIVARGNMIWGNRIGGILLGGAGSDNGGSEYNQVLANTLWANDTRADGNGEIQFNHWCHHNTLRHNLVITGTQALLCSNPVAATIGGKSTNSDNQFDWNLWWSPGGALSSEWQWKNTYRTGFAAWKTATAQDSHSLFTDPRLRNPSLTGSSAPDLHLRADSPAIDAGDPAVTPAPDERDIDRLSRLTGARLDLGADELSPYDAWRLPRFGSTEPPASAPAADADNDGLANILEYAFGGDPLAPSSTPWPRAGAFSFENDSQPTLTFTRQSLAADLTYRVQVSIDLINWVNGSSYGPFGDLPDTAAATEIARIPASGGEAITVRASLTGTPSRRFMRIAAKLEPSGP